jgi:hypothetical protein
MFHVQDLVIIPCFSSIVKAQVGGAVTVWTYIREVCV